MRQSSHDVLKATRIGCVLGLLPLVIGLVLGAAPHQAHAEAIAASETNALKQIYSPRVYRSGGRSFESRGVTIITPSSNSRWRSDRDSGRYSDRYSDRYVIDGEIEDSVLFNPVIIDSSIEDSTLINPVIVDSPGRVYIRRGQSAGRSSCLVLASYRAACR